MFLLHHHLLMRYAGLSIQDATTLRRDAMDGPLLAIRRSKSGELLICELPRPVQARHGRALLAPAARPGGPAGRRGGFPHAPAQGHVCCRAAGRRGVDR